jgi:hypothetical protein
MRRFYPRWRAGGKAKRDFAAQCALRHFVEDRHHPRPLFCQVSVPSRERDWGFAARLPSRTRHTRSTVIGNSWLIC